MRLPMASDVGVMEHVWLTPYADGKLGERMQFGAAGSTVQGPELMMKYCALVTPTIMIRKTPHGPAMRGRPGGYCFDGIFYRSENPTVRQPSPFPQSSSLASKVLLSWFPSEKCITAP